jgi:hypothetical protein
MQLLELFAQLTSTQFVNGEIPVPNGRFFEKEGRLAFTDGDGSLLFGINEDQVVPELLVRSGLCREVRVIPAQCITAV